MKFLGAAAILAVLLASSAAEDFQIIGTPSDGRPAVQPVRSDKPAVWPHGKPKARAGVLVARYVPQHQLQTDVVLAFANITYRIVGEDMQLDKVLSKYADFELAFKKLYGSANLYASLLHVREAEPGEGTTERPCRGEFSSCCLHKGPIADPEIWAAIDVTLSVGCSRESLWPDQGSLDWAQSRMLGTLLTQHGFHEVRCLLQRADVLPEGVHAHKYLPITALYTEETTVQFTGNSLSQWLPVDVATQNLILHSMDLIGLNRIAGCARIRITTVSQRCNWEPGRGQIGIANVTFVTHREYPETTLPMAFAKTFHILLERLNEEGLNLAKIEVVANRIVRGPEWGNMHDQIESLIGSDDPIRTYETRVPDEELPNFPRYKSGLPVAYTVATALMAILGAIAFMRRRAGPPAAPADRPRTVPLSAVGGALVHEANDSGSFPRRESAPAAPGAREVFERISPHMPHAASMAPAVTLPAVPAALEPLSDVPRVSSDENVAFDLVLESMRLRPESTRSRNDMTFADLPAMSSGSADSIGRQTELHSGPSHTLPWDPSVDAPNPFLADASGSLSGASEYRSQGFRTVPAATVIQQGSQDTTTEQQLREQMQRTQQLRERGARFEQQLARADSVASWLVPDREIEICLRDDGKRYLLGAGAYGKVYRGLRGGIQDVAVKVLHTTDEFQINQFCLEIKLLKSLSFDRNIVQFLGVCLHAGSPMLILEFMEGGDLRQALSGPSQHRYRWADLGQYVALDVVRGLHFLHSQKVVHSDLKSRNVLLGRDGITAKLSDVGMSRILSGSRSAVPGHAHGTFPYAAPELLLAQSCTVKADIFSLGVLIWEIITRESPVRGQMRTLVVPDDCPESIAELVNRCWSSDENERPSARDVFDLIRIAGASQVATVPSLASTEELPSDTSSMRAQR